MVSEERLKWINDRLQHGDKTRLTQLLNLPYFTIVDILRGKYFGDSGEEVLSAAEKMIKNREKKIMAEKQKYTDTQC